MKKNFSTPIEQEISEAFKAYCKEHGLKMNDVLEEFMKAVANGTIKLKSEVSFITKD